MELFNDKEFSFMELINEAKYPSVIVKIMENLKNVEKLHKLEVFLRELLGKDDIEKIRKAKEKTDKDKEMFDQFSCMYRNMHKNITGKYPDDLLLQLFMMNLEGIGCEKNLSLALEYLDLVDDGFIVGKSYLTLYRNGENFKIGYVDDNSGDVAYLYELHNYWRLNNIHGFEYDIDSMTENDQFELCYYVYTEKIKDKEYNIDRSLKLLCEPCGYDPFDHYNINLIYKRYENKILDEIVTKCIKDNKESCGIMLYIKELRDLGFTRFPDYITPSPLNILSMRELINGDTGNIQSLLLSAAMELRVEDVERLLDMDEQLVNNGRSSVWKSNNRQEQRGLWKEVLWRLRL